MTFKSFILSIPLQIDPTINWVITFVKNDADFPDTDNLETIAKHIYLNLNEKQTLAFQKSLIMYWCDAEKYHLAPTATLIVDLQDGDENYQYKRYQY